VGPERVIPAPLRGMALLPLGLDLDVSRETAGGSAGAEPLDTRPCPGPASTAVFLPAWFRP
jgi:hypothetical protein